MSTAMGTQKWMSVKMETSREGDSSILFAKARGASAGAMLGQKRGLGQCRHSAVLGPSRLRPKLGRLAGPHAGGESADGGEVEFFVELDSGMVLRRYREREFAKLQGAKRFGGGLHQHTAEAVTLVAGENADLRGVADAGRNLAGEDGGNKFVAAGLAKNEGSAGNELAAAR